MKKFNVNGLYSMRSACDHGCVWQYVVTKRTAKTITVTDGKETKTLRISQKLSEYRDAETVFPLGQYSMAPMLTAY